MPFTLVQFSRLWFVNITKILFLFFSFFMELFLFLKFALNQFFFYFLVSKKIVSKSFTTTEKKPDLVHLKLERVKINKVKMGFRFINLMKFAFHQKKKKNSFISQTLSLSLCVKTQRARKLKYRSPPTSWVTVVSDLISAASSSDYRCMLNSLFVSREKKILNFSITEIT